MIDGITTNQFESEDELCFFMMEQLIDFAKKNRQVTLPASSKSRPDETLLGKLIGQPPET